jgi:spermidine/putrescine transport system substrate-binding protein
MKKLLLMVAIWMLPCALVTTAMAADREHTLKVYNWADYIDMDVLNGFPAWYYEQTGEQVEVLYQTFDINESMLTEIEVGHEDYDVICPSEYIIERMLRNGLLQKINKDFGSTPDYTQLVSPFAVDKFQQMAPDSSVCVADYTVGYMWGTTGILYNTALVEKEEILSLGGLTNAKFAGKVFMKDAFRDIYSVVVLYAYRDEIARGEVQKDELVANVTDERIQRVEEFLTSMKNNIAGWEVDFGKEEMTKGKAWLNLSWSGDAQWAIDEAAEVGVDLEYFVPQEGSNVWFDGWCIPVYAKNTKAASYFINYMCMPENAILNMEEIGYVSVVASPEILEWANDEEVEEVSNLSYFFGEGAEAVHANHVFYPDQSVIERCALMHDCGEKTEAMLAMWSRVKGDNLSTGLVVFILVVLAMIMVVVVLQALKRKHQRELQRKKRNRRRR